MSPLFASRALLFAGECIAASSLALLLAWTASAFLRQAGARHLAWLTAFGVALVLPLAAAIVPPSIVIAQSAAAAPAPPVLVDTDEAAAVVVAPPPPAPRFALPELGARNVALALFAVWLAGFSWAMLRLALGALGLTALKRASRPHALEPADLPRHAAQGRECELRLSTAQEGPLTWGVLRPIVLLPRSALAWPRERLQAVLLHELAHVRRRDSLSQLVSLLASAVYWFNPLIWLGARALRREAEMAADDAVLALGVRPSDYAGALLRVAGEFRGHAVALNGVAMAQGSALEARVTSVLAQNRSRKGVTAMDVVKTACLGVVLTAALAVLRPGIVEAQDTPAAAPTPPAAAAPAAPPDAVDMVAPDAAPAEPADVAEPAQPARPAKARHRHHVVQIDGKAPGQHVVRMIDMGGDGQAHCREAERAREGGNRPQIAMAQAQARRAQAEIAKIGPEIERAIAAAHVDENVARALEQARPAIHKAIVDAHISEKVANALAEAQPRIEAALAQARVRMETERRRMRDESRREEVGDVEPPDAPDAGDESGDGSPQ